MKRVPKSFIALAVMVLLFVLVTLWHLGPIGIQPGETVLCSSFTCTNGSRLFVVARRTSHYLDPYDIYLYRLRSDGEIYRYRLADEDSFWWKSSLCQINGSSEIAIRSFGQFVAKYSTEEDAVVWLDRNRPPEFAEKSVDPLVARFLLHGNE